MYPLILRTFVAVAVLAGTASPLISQSAVSCPSVLTVADPASDAPAAVVHYLSDPQLDRRRTGTAGEYCAREYIAARFLNLGLSPAGDSGSYFQAVAVWGSPAVPPANVVALLPGSDPTLRGEAIVVGAHHDHLGRDSTGAVYPGADDNASGVAAVVRVAELLRGSPPRRTVVFVTFTAEESMMFGSNHYVEDPVIPLQSTVAMINLDMVGRLSTQPLHISGLSTHPRWEEMLRRAKHPSLPWQFTDAVERGSDHLPFHRAGVPVLYMKTGRHDDYHQPTDTAEKVDVSGIDAVAQLVERIIRVLEEGD